jgi:hypothetical protein
VLGVLAAFLMQDVSWIHDWQYSCQLFDGEEHPVFEAAAGLGLILNMVD